MSLNRKKTELTEYCLLAGRCKSRVTAGSLTETAHHRHDSKLHGAIVAVEASFLSAGEVIRLPFLQHVLETFSSALSRVGELLSFTHVALHPCPQVGEQENAVCVGGSIRRIELEHCKTKQNKNVTELENTFKDSRFHELRWRTESVVDEEGAVLDSPVDVVNAELPVRRAADGDLVGSLGGVWVSVWAVGFVKAGAGVPVSDRAPVRPGHGNSRHGCENCSEQEKCLMGSCCHI